MAAEMICTSCGTQGQPMTHTPGSFLIEIVLWLFFIVPGLIYSIWRHTQRRKVCRACGAATMVPVSSPIGRRLVGGAA